MKKIVLLSGIAILGIASSLNSQTTYTYDPSLGPLNDPNSWGDEFFGFPPLNFTDPDQIFKIDVPTATLANGESWTVQGSNSGILVGNGTSNTNLIISPNATLQVTNGATLTVSNNATLTLQAPVSALPPSNLVTAESGSAIKWDQTTSQSIWAIKYHNLIIANNSMSLTGGQITEISGTYTGCSSCYLNMGPNTFLVLRGHVSGGDIYLNPTAATTSLSILGPATTPVNINFPSGNKVIGLYQQNRSTVVKMSKPTNTLQVGFGSNNCSITSGTLDLSNAVDVRLFSNGTWNFGTNGYIRGSQTLSLTLSGTGNVTGTLKFDQTNASTRSLKRLSISKSGKTVTLGNQLDIYGEVFVLSSTSSTNSST
jgi:hypothetical protein